MVVRVDGPDDLELALLGDARVVGVTAGASAPEELVQAVIAKLAPRGGVEAVHATLEDEYFPPPRELREVLPALVRTVLCAAGVDPGLADGRTVFGDDRSLDAAAVLVSGTSPAT